MRALDEVRLGGLAPPAPGLDLVDARALGGAHLAAQVRAELGEHALERPQRVDADDAEEPLGMGHEQVQRQVATPRVADRPGPIDLEVVEDGDCV